MEKAEYLIVGNGKTAKHISHYFEILNIPFNSWNRNQSIQFEEMLTEEKKILVLIPDDQIEKFIEEQKSKVSAQVLWIHFSGVLSTPLAESAHPLFTFHNSLYDLATYKSIPFITERGRKTFSELFPELRNTSYEIEPSNKSLYHAWCSIAGNFTSILWSEFFNRLENQFHLPKETAFPYLKQVALNTFANPGSLTGPLVRSDNETINKHLETLKDDDFYKIYNSFKELYENKTRRERV